MTVSGFIFHITLLATLLPVSAFAQSFYGTMPSQEMYTPVERDDGQLFYLNPAVVQPTGTKLGGYLLRRERTSTLTLSDATSTKTSRTENGFGAGAIFDLGAGAAAGITAEKTFSAATIDSGGTSRTKPIERMVTQTLTGRVLIDLATGLRVGLALRFMNEQGDILGSASANDSARIKYDGSLVGHGGGVQYAVDNFAIGAAYFPAARGKTEIISEERIITEPGVAVIDFRLKADKHVFGLGVERAVHKRDERITVTGESGQGSVALDGISPDKNTFAKQTFHGAFDWMITGTISVRGGLANHQRVWIFDSSSVPASSSGDSYSYNEWQAALHLMMPIDIVTGLRFDSYETKLSGQSGSARNNATYESGGRVLFVTASSKL